MPPWIPPLLCYLLHESSGTPVPCNISALALCCSVDENAETLHSSRKAPCLRATNVPGSPRFDHGRCDTLRTAQRRQNPRLSGSKVCRLRAHRIVDASLSAPVEGGRHRRRIDRIRLFEHSHGEE